MHTIRTQERTRLHEQYMYWVLMTFMLIDLHTLTKESVRLKHLEFATYHFHDKSAIFHLIMTFLKGGIKRHLECNAIKLPSVIRFQNQKKQVFKKQKIR